MTILLLNIHNYMVNVDGDNNMIHLKKWLWSIWLWYVTPREKENEQDDTRLD